MRTVIFAVAHSSLPYGRTELESRFDTLRDLRRPNQPEQNSKARVKEQLQTRRYAMEPFSRKHGRNIRTSSPRGLDWVHAKALEAIVSSHNKRPDRKFRKGISWSSRSPDMVYLSKPIAWCKSYDGLMMRNRIANKNKRRELAREKSV